MVRLLFIQQKGFESRIALNDIDILKTKFDVSVYIVNNKKSLSFIFSFLKEFFYLLFNIHKFKIVFIWFADYHSMLPVFFSKLFSKKCILIAGGFDAYETLTTAPGNLKDKFRKFCTKYSFANATEVVAVSENIKGYLTKYIPGRKSTVLYNNVDTGRIIPPDAISQKENLIITVGGGLDEGEALNKKLDLFFKIGEEFVSRYPEYNAEFFAIGHDENSDTHKLLKQFIKSHGLQIKPKTKSIDELVNYYKRASVYMQLSENEAFGIAQAEAMMFGCIPVSGDGGAIPEVVGDAGFIVKNYNMNEFIELIKEVLDKKHESLREKSRDRILTNFTLQNRKYNLLKFMEKYDH